MRPFSTRGFSLIETLVALALVVSVSAALLPAVALASRLQRESAIETEGAAIAASCLEQVKAGVGAGAIGDGGSIDTPIDGWHVRATASFECRWQSSALAAPAGLRVLAVRVVPLAGAGLSITMTSVVADD